jgi:hypothetical protein
MLHIELNGRTVAVPNVHTSERHYVRYTSAALMGLGVRTREALGKATGARACAKQVQLYVVERELLRRGVVPTYSEKALEVSNIILEACL